MYFRFEFLSYTQLKKLALVGIFIIIICDHTTSVSQEDDGFDIIAGDKVER